MMTGLYVEELPLTSVRDAIWEEHFSSISVVLQQLSERARQFFSFSSMSLI
jgi:hypothetical protein